MTPAADKSQSPELVCHQGTEGSLQGHGIREQRHSGLPLHAQPKPRSRVMNMERCFRLLRVRELVPPGRPLKSPLKMCCSEKPGWGRDRH